MIDIKNLSKEYGKIKALEDITLSLHKKEIVFLVGPNGAGKSTMMKLISGYICPSAGEVLIEGKSVQADRDTLSYLGYVPENAPLYGDMSAYEYIRYVADLWKLSDEEFDKNMTFVLDNLQLREVLNQKIETLSKGFRRRVAIAGALIHKPSILILDEPTEGLDPNQKFELHRFLQEYENDHLIIISTHLMEEVEAIADRVILINKGHLIWDGTPGELKRLSSEGSVAMAFRLLTRGEKV